MISHKLYHWTQSYTVSLGLTILPRDIEGVTL